MESIPENYIKINKKYSINRLNLIIAIISALVMIALGLAEIFIFNFNLRETAEMSFLLMTFYALLMFILAIRKSLVKVERIQTKIKLIEKFVDRPVVERVVVHEPGKTKTRTITKIVNRIKTIKQKPKRLNIPH